MADDDLVQPDEGQGGESRDTHPWDEYLNRIPEEVRGDVEPVFRDWDANTTRKFQEHAEYRKQWEPLEAIGVNQRDPETLEWAMQFVDALEDPSAIQRWFSEYAEQNGLTPAQQQEMEQEYVDPTVESLVEQRLAQQLGPVAQQMQELADWRSAQEQQRAEAEASAQIEAQLEDLKDKHPNEFDRDLVEMFVANHMDDPSNAVQLAFADAQRVFNQIQRDTLEGKLKQPPGAESGGQASGAPDPPPKGEALKWAAEQAMEQLRGNRLA